MVDQVPQQAPVKKGKGWFFYFCVFLLGVFLVALLVLVALKYFKGWQIFVFLGAVGVLFLVYNLLKRTSVTNLDASDVMSKVREWMLDQHGVLVPDDSMRIHITPRAVYVWFWSAIVGHRVLTLDPFGKKVKTYELLDKALWNRLRERENLLNNPELDSVAKILVKEMIVDGRFN